MFRITLSLYMLNLVKRTSIVDFYQNVNNLNEGKHKICDKRCTLMKLHMLFK